jgi:regulation of enolase protein 1 (concanavalin A-like superfamily)
MYRVATLWSILALTVVVAVTVVVAAPAPFSGDRGVWVRGWDRPVDSVGDCHFSRRGNTLTITVPGKGHDGDLRIGRFKCPRLLRQVEGDFTVEVRVRGNFEAPENGANDVYRGAGVLVMDDMVCWRMERVSGWRIGSLAFWRSPLPQRPRRDLGGGRLFGSVSFAEGPPLAKPAHLRLERRGNDILTAESEDGRKWGPLESTLGGKGLPRKLKVGVFAEALVDGTFKAVFDEFKLTLLNASAR